MTYHKLTIALAVIGLSLTNCKTPQTAIVPTNNTAPKGQTLVWEENFNADTINLKTWTYDLGNGCDRRLCGWGNSEMEYYTNRKENARIERGNLVIEAHHETLDNRSFTSARLKTQGLMQFKYGTIEARIKIPKATSGVWPAFWTLGTVGKGWPAIGEIDMMEVGSKEALKEGLGNRRVSSAAHWSKADGAHDFNVFYHDAAVDLSADYHFYKMVWTRQAIKMYLDNIEYYTLDISGGEAANLSEFHDPHYLLLNVAVGGAYTGIFTEGGINAPLPAKMYVDYVKLYQNEGDSLYLTANTKARNKHAVLINNTSTITSNNDAADNNYLNLAAAPTPTKPANTVISLFSNAYANRPIDTWSADWSNADMTSLHIKNNETKRYSNLIFAGVEFTKNPIDATTATHLHMDIWTPNSTVFKVKLVDFGANGVYQGATNDDSEYELSFTPALGKWISYDISLSDFKDLKARAHLAQLILVGSNSQVYVDNVYFFNHSGKTID
jgi:beta-glucanase (GH16 family)